MSATNDTFDTGDVLPRIAHLRVIGPALMEVAWAGGARAGRVDSLDLSPLLNSYKIYRLLRNNAVLFAAARLVDEGDAILWGDTGIDMSSETLETLAEETMTADEFGAFLKRHNLTQEAAAALLGRSRRQVGYYLSRGPIPRVIALACLGYDASRTRKRQGSIDRPLGGQVP